MNTWRPHPSAHRHALTAVELIVIIAVAAGLALLTMVPRGRPGRPPSARIRCVNNLKQIGTAYRVWCGDNGGDQFQYPAQSTNGWSRLCPPTNGGAFCWVNYVVMSNELGQLPRVLVCPADDKTQPATNFSASAFGNQNVSYFVGLQANESYPQSVIAGDRNLAPGPVPGNDYGYSRADRRGNDDTVSTNPAINPLCWSLKMHSAAAGNTNGAGNVLLGDGSVQMVTTPRFRTEVQPFAGTTNSPSSFRLIFP